MLQLKSSPSIRIKEQPYIGYYIREYSRVSSTDKFTLYISSI